MDDDSDCQRRRGDLLIQLKMLDAIRAGTWKADADTPLMAARRAILDDAPPAAAPPRQPTLRVIQGGKSDK
ncbi:hypothetical protein [Azospirillum sp.]|uniref:hypothetical protein n=1 Tax=Azospirillum sp. TaxID=34012 RepID=UPI00263A2BA1|nr:hypothetical protein [Azospirillum sp.]